MSTDGKDSAQLERELEEQRLRIEDRVHEIRDRLSPGQLVDEVLNYTKTGGQQFASNLGGTIAANPLPAALLGISLIWLMSGNKSSGTSPADHHRSSSDEYPYSTVAGPMRRIDHAADDSGEWYSHFEDTTGKRFKAKSNEAGHRLGAFVDDTGRSFGGFIDDAGHRVRVFSDELGNRFGDATGWASHRVDELRHGVADAAAGIAHHAQEMGGSVQHKMSKANDALLRGLHDQPLVAGAIAFAAGAALGATLPHTAQEDALLGDVADKAKAKAVDVASDAYEEGKKSVASAYERTQEGAEQVLDTANDQLASTSDHASVR